jgi:hypothetical protein
VIAALVFVAANFRDQARAQNPLESVRIGYATSSGQAAALWITQDAAFLKRTASTSSSFTCKAACA